MKKVTIEQSASKDNFNYVGKSVQYSAVKQEIQHTWPDWKKKAYNDNFANSAHAKKIII